MTGSNTVCQHCSIEIKDEEEYMMEEANGSNQTSMGNRDVKAIVSSIQRKLCRESPLPTECCIFRVPDILRRHNEKVFKPKLISIGPFHHGKKKLQKMEKIKLWYLHCLLDREPTPETSLESFVNAIGSIEQYCRECYGEEICYSGEKFVEMMVVDGCFLIEFFRKFAQVEPHEYKVELIDEDDPVDYTSWMFLQITSELLLLENQLPWRVLNCLFDMTNDRSCPISLASLAAYTFTSLFPSKHLHPNNNLQNRHLLELLRNYLLGSYANKQPQPISSWTLHIPTVMELLQAGVRFKKREEIKDNGILDITFNDDGVMEIPQISVSENTETMFRNLVAFEQYEKHGKNKITSYVVLLDNLINSRKDLDFLVQENIVCISNSFNTEYTEIFFNRLVENTGYKNFLYQDLYKRVNAHYKSRWNKWRAILKRNYFNNPWSIFSFIAAVVILLLSFQQTIYAMLSYHQPHQS